MKQISDELYERLEYLGIIGSGGTRDFNVGKSDYSKNIIQPWTIWIAYQKKLTAFDLDIIKRVLREKSEEGMSKEESRIMDYKKVIHICQERVRQLQHVIDHTEDIADRESGQTNGACRKVREEDGRLPYNHHPIF